MSKITAVVLRDTDHVVATYSQNSGGSEDVSSDLLEHRFECGLHLRLLPQSHGTPGLTTAEPLTPTTTSIVIEPTEEAKKIQPGQVFQITDGDNVAVLVVSEVLVATGPDKVTLTIKLRRAPKADIAAGMSLDPVQRSPKDKPFSFLSRHLSAAEIPPSELPLLSRPISLSLKDKKAFETPQVGEGVDSVEFEVRQTGVKVTIVPVTDTTTPSNDKTISFETPVVCALRTPDKQNVVSTVEIPAAGQGLKATANIPFAVIPGGDNYFLFMLKGFQPIWDKLQVGEKRIWKPTSP